MLKNIFSNWSYILLSAISVFALYPYFTSVMGEQQYGVWLLVSSVTGYFALLQLGVPLANVRYVSKYHATDETDKLNEVLSSNLCFFFIIALVVLTVGTAISCCLDRFFKIPAELQTVARVATVLASLDVALKFVFEVFEGVVHGLQRFMLLNAVKNVGIVAKMALIYLFLTNHDGIVKLSMVLILITVCQGLAFFLLARRFLPRLRLSRQHLNKGMFKEVMTYSVYVLILQAGARLSFQTDALVIGSCISVSAIIWFTLANNILIYLMQFITGISQALMPKVSSLDAKGDTSKLRESYLEYSKLTFLLVMPICIGLFVLGGDFISLWMGKKFAAVSGEVLTILTSSYLFFLVQRGVAYPILMGTSKMRFLSILMLSTALLNLVLSLLWSRQHGIYGVAWGTTVPNFINVAAIVWYMCTSYGINPLQYLLKTTITPGLIGCAGFAVMTAARALIAPDNFLSLAIDFGIGTLFYGVLVQLFYFNGAFRFGPALNRLRGA